MEENSLDEIEIQNQEEPKEVLEENESENLKESSNYEENTWYHPVALLDQGYIGDLKESIKEENFITNNWDKFKESLNPFQLYDCTYFAWSRFYQIYGFDSGARGNGKTNAAEIVKMHPDQFELSSTPAAGATFSIEKNTTYPECGHVGFVEAFDGTYMYISEGNVIFNGEEGYIWIHKVKWEDYKQQYPDITFAIPKKENNDLIKSKQKSTNVFERKFLFE